MMQQVTDAAGRFAFTGLAAAEYAVTATKLGYAEGALGRRRPDGLFQTVALTEGQLVGDLTILVWKKASVAGIILDEWNEPFGRVHVRILRRILVGGRSGFVLAGSSTTDERGFYRIGSLVPGEYVVEVPSTQLSAPESLIQRFAQPAEPGVAPRNAGAEFVASDKTLELLVTGSGASVDQVRLRQPFASHGPSSKFGSRLAMYPVHYFASGRTIDEATPVSIGVGDERRGVDVRLSPVPAQRVSGTVQGPEGPVIVSVSLTPRSEYAFRTAVSEAAITFSDVNGQFLFPAVAKGDYWLQVTAVPDLVRGQVGPTRPNLWLTVPVNVTDTNLTDLTLHLRRGFRVAGRINFEGNGRLSPDSLRRVVITVESADARVLKPPRISRIAVQPDGSFASTELPEGSYFLRLNSLPLGWVQLGATFEGRDISNVALTVDRDISGVLLKISDRGAELIGSVQNASGLKHSGATVLVFPVESSSWVDYGNTPPGFRSSRTGVDGSYRVSGLLPGDYFVVAVAEEAAMDWQEGRLLKILAQVASRLTVTPGEAKSLNLRVVELRR